MSRKVNHKDAEVHEELYRQCGRMQGKINLSNLCLTVLGGQGADIVSKAVNKCVKESKSFDKADDSKAKGSPQEEQAAKFGGGHHWQAYTHIRGQCLVQGMDFLVMGFSIRPTIVMVVLGRVGDIGCHDVAGWHVTSVSQQITW